MPAPCEITGFAPIVLSTSHWKMILWELLSSEVAVSKSDAEQYRAIINLIIAQTGLNEEEIVKEMEG